jgi:hypothetical protein
MGGARNIIRTVKTAADAAIALLWAVVMTTYLLGLHHEAHTLAAHSRICFRRNGHEPSGDRTPRPAYQHLKPYSLVGLLGAPGFRARQQVISGRLTRRLATAAGYATSNYEIEDGDRIAHPRIPRPPEASVR